MSSLDYESWRCKHETPGRSMFCPPEGCSLVDGCYRDSLMTPFERDAEEELDWQDRNERR